VQLEPVSVVLKFGFLIVLYLFLLWVARSALKDLRGGAAPADDPMEATGLHAASAGLSAGSIDGAEPRLRVVQASGLRGGDEYDLVDGLTLGRGEAVDVRIEDPFASSRHARIVRQGDLLVLEDLGSTNGTFLNRDRLSKTMPLRRGDKLQIGHTVLEIVQ
jgi:hypothetical protein